MVGGCGCLCVFIGINISHDLLSLIQEVLKNYHIFHIIEMHCIVDYSRHHILGHLVNGTTFFMGPFLPGLDLKVLQSSICEKPDIGTVRILGPLEPGPNVAISSTHCIYTCISRIVFYGDRIL